ncbi:MAG: 30S ribosomal protein S19 [Candidatus Aenigmarchaeota archaeon]|nr:30S ribosomal protein S19 [Candidatus Aenigmarchaeota archaeon]
MAKEFYFRGRTPEELQTVPLDEFVKLLNARQRRLFKRGLTGVQKKLVERIKTYKNSDKLIRTKARDMIILPGMIGAKLGIYDGKEYKPVIVTGEMLGHYIGEFAQTRKKVQHGSPGFGATRASKFVPLK